MKKGDKFPLFLIFIYMKLYDIVITNIITENVQQAEKVLKSKGVRLDDPNYIDFKNHLIKNNNVGYLGLITKMSADNGRFFKHTAADLYDAIINYKSYLPQLPKPLMQYDYANELFTDIQKIIDKNLIKKISNKLTNKILKQQLPNYKLETGEDLKYFLNIDPSDQKEFLSKTDKYKDVETFLRDLSEFNEDHRIGFNYQNVIKEINSIPANEINLLFTENQMILARILSFEASSKIGSKSWCIVGSQELFDDYTKNGENFQYFFFNFNSGVKANEKMIAFTMDKENNITASHDRYDGNFNDALGYLSKLGIKERIFIINSRERAKASIQKTIPLSLLISMSKDYHSDNWMETDRSIDDPVGILDEFIKSVIENKAHLDIIVKTFENYPVKIIKSNNEFDPETQDLSYYKSNINLIPDIIGEYSKQMSKSKVNSHPRSEWIQNKIERRRYYHNPYDRGVFKYSAKISQLVKDLKDIEKIMIDVFIKIFNSSIPIMPDSKQAIMYFLKDNGIDVLELQKHKKLKTGEDFSSMEFAMLKNKGENLKPLIQNKLTAIRRGEDVSMNSVEINYAIDNGYKDIVKKYYQNDLPEYAENQVDYDTLNIYRKLGMFNDIEKIIVHKGNQWGLDSLNSIEKSVYDMNKAKSRLQENFKRVNLP